jgi:hypothetical protein
MMWSMAAATELAAVFDRQVDAAQFEVIGHGSATLSAAREGYLRAIANVITQIDNFAATTRETERIVTAILAEAEPRVADRSVTVAELDDLIDSLEKQEQTIGSRLLPALSGDASRQVFQLPREWRAKHIEVLRRQEAETYRALEFLRDSRWRLMSLRSDLEEMDDSPVFDSADALGRHLDSL